jgi:lipopolysaccharide transport system permease protein
VKLFLDHFRELWRYRVLIESLVWREVKARYRGSALGWFWTFLNPLFQLIIYRFVFQIATRGVTMHDYAVFLFIGLLPWGWLATTVPNAALSILAGGSLVTRVCMPPQVLPMVHVLSNLVNYLLAIPIALGAAAWYGRYPTTALVALPLVILIQFVFLYGVGALLASLTVSYRDIQFLVQNLMMVWFFMTPVVYSFDETIPPKYRGLLMANPTTPLLLSYQRIFYHRQMPEPEHLLLAAAWAVALLVLGVSVFERRRDVLAEEI